MTVVSEQEHEAELPERWSAKAKAVMPRSEGRSDHRPGDTAVQGDSRGPGARGTMRCAVDSGARRLMCCLICLHVYKPFRSSISRTAWTISLSVVVPSILLSKRRRLARAFPAEPPPKRRAAIQRCDCSASHVAP